MVISFLVLLQTPDPAAILERHQNWVKENRAYKVDFEVKYGSNPLAGTGSLRVDFPRRMKYTMRWANEDYEYSVTEKGIVEIERIGKSYDELAPLGRIVIIDSAVGNSLSYGFPGEVFGAPVNSAIPAAAKFSYVGSETVANVVGDKIQAKFESQAGNADLEAVIGPAGEPLRYRLVTISPDGSVDRQFTFRNWQTQTNTAITDFAITIPLGFEPVSVPREATPTEAGAPASIGVWKSVGGKDFDFDKNLRKRLVLVVDSDCPASSRLLTELPNLKSHAKDAGAELVVLALGEIGPLDVPVFTATDRSSKRVPGTPMTMVVAADGKLVQAIYGFDSAKPKTFLDDLLAALKRP
jgi:hypothetical protein